MSVRDGTCDWCDRGRLMDTGDERSLIQFGKLWCGVCREGSRERYKNVGDDWLTGQIEIIEELLEQHPIVWEGHRDHMRMHLFKLDNYDEQYRMQCELEFRHKEKQ